MLIKSLGRVEQKKKKIKIKCFIINEGYVAIVFNVFVNNIHRCSFMELKWTEKSTVSFNRVSINLLLLLNTIYTIHIYGTNYIRMK